MDVYWAAPPVSRTITAISLLMSALAHTRFIDVYKLLFIPQFVFKQLPPEIWRLPASCLLTRPGMSIFFEPYLLYMYGSGLERESSKFTQPGDFFMYVLFVCAVSMGLANYFLGAVMFLPALSAGLAYTFAQDNGERQINFFFIPMPAKYLPLASLFITFVLGGPQMMFVQITGLLAAHLHDFITRIWPTFGNGVNILKTPRFVAKWFGGGAPQQRAYGRAYPGRAAVDRGVNDGSSSGVGGFGSPWSRRGTGRRVGD